RNHMEETRMKKILLILALACLLTGHAYADVFNLDADTALRFRQIPTGASWLHGVFDLTTTPPTQVYPVFGLGVLGYPDHLAKAEVGFVGTISGDGEYMRIGLRDDEFGTYTGFRARIANDNQSVWSVRLFANGYTGNWQRLYPPELSTDDLLRVADLEIPFEGEEDLTKFGFDVLLNTGSECYWPSMTDTVHVSVLPTPVPAAALLALLGLGTAGMRLRKLV
ncbi:MAG: hypothetical protein ACM3VT_08730, partial [Solirubrobacterales bacterium]